MALGADLPVQRPHDADPRGHHEIAAFCGTDQAGNGICQTSWFCPAFGNFMM
jgi:hypothetical protein